jgi:RNA polymerase sigma-70 factor (ECF subfamily)
MSYNRPGVNKAGQRASIQAHGRSATTNVDDHDLVFAARKGDRDAFKTLFERYHRRAYALAFGVLRHPDDALDVVQDAFIKAHKYLDKFEGNSSFYTWLYRIVMNLAIDHLRKHRRVKPVELDESRLEDAAESSLLPRILGGNPSRSLMDKQIRIRIDQALEELSENHRSVLVMRELEGLSYEEMAQTMGCSKGTIMSRLFHARKNMQKRLIDLVENPSKELLAELGMKPGEIDGADAAAEDDDAAASGAR